MPAPRLNRLPLRLDYTLIPAPLDLSRPLADEKSSTPTIIVTPASPTSPADFSIAFFQPLETQQSLVSKLSSHRVNLWKFNVTQKTRGIFFLLLACLILVCHLLTHSLHTRYPALKFNRVSKPFYDTFNGDPHFSSDGSTPESNFRTLLTGTRREDHNPPIEFIVDERDVAQELAS